MNKLTEHIETLNKVIKDGPMPVLVPVRDFLQSLADDPWVIDDANGDGVVAVFAGTPDQTESRFVGDGEFLNGKQGDVFVQRLRNGKVIQHSPLDPRLDLALLAPPNERTFFSWGDSTGSAGQLALAILTGITSDAKALTAYRDFRDEVIAKLEARKPWEMSQEAVYDWLLEWEQNHQDEVKAIEEVH